MELVYCCAGMTIFCASAGIFLSIISLLLPYFNKEAKAKEVLSLSQSFANCAFYFLALEIVARFFA